MNEVVDDKLNYLLMLKAACKMEMVKLTKEEWDGLGVFDAMFLLHHEVNQQEELDFHNKMRGM